MCSDFTIPERLVARLSTGDDSTVGVGVDFLGGDSENRTVIFANPRIVQGPLEADYMQTSLSAEGVPTSAPSNTSDE